MQRNNVIVFCFAKTSDLIQYHSIQIYFSRNIVHGSDAAESAKREISLWFKDDEIAAWAPCTETWIYE